MEKNTKIFEGISTSAFTSIFWLVLTFLKKQKAIIIFSILLLLTLTSSSFLVSTRNITIDFVGKLLFFMVIFIPIMFSLISIPQIQTQISSSTLIKRIGSTRINENTFVLNLWFSYMIIIFSMFWFLYIWALVFAAIANLGLDEILGSFWKIFLISPFYISLFVSTGILIAAIPIGDVFKAIISIFILIFILLFSNVLYDSYQLITNTTTSGFIRSVFIICLATPWTSSTYLMYTSFVNIATISIGQYLAILCYTIGSSFVMVLFAFMFQSFEKVK